MRALVTLFVVIDPIGTLPVVLFATQGVPRPLDWMGLILAPVAVDSVSGGRESPGILALAPASGWAAAGKIAASRQRGRGPAASCSISVPDARPAIVERGRP